MRYILLVLFVTLLVACSRKIAGPNKSTGSVNSSTALVTEVNAKGIQSKWIQAKVQVALDGGGFLSSGTASIRSCKDSILWISITKLGIEVLRGIILKDSAFWVNEWENTYWRGSIEDIKNKYKVPANLGDLQDLIFPTINPDMEYAFEKKDQTILLSQPGILNKRYEISDQTRLIQKLNLTHLDTDLKLDYTDYKLTEGFWFPYIQNLHIRQPAEVHETKLKFTLIQSAEHLSTPFRIPGDYTPAE
ncbi:MAG: DUF4292 domain-containing protein [Saprospiraceae bacterium]|nr:DUF4292 domain-containing protein [Saprospiraceae bacterium]